MSRRQAKYFQYINQSASILSLPQYGVDYDSANLEDFLNDLFFNNSSYNAAIRLPIGTTAQQPAGINGLMRYDSDVNKFKAYEAGSWKNMITGGVGATLLEYQVAHSDALGNIVGNNNFLYDYDLNKISLIGDIDITGTVNIVGDLIQSSPTQNVIIEDPMIKMGHNNGTNLIDLGVYWQYNDGTTRYGGIFRDQNDSGVIKVYKDLTVEPTTTVNTGGTGYSLANMAGADPTAATHFTTKNYVDTAFSTAISVGENEIAYGNATGDLISSSNLTYNGSSFKIGNTTNQLILGTTNTITINSVAPSTSRIYTIPDVSSTANFAMIDAAITGQITYGGGFAGKLTSSANFIYSSGNLSLNNFGKIININDPTNPQDAATKAYVDGLGVSQPANQVVYGTGTGLTSSSILTFNGSDFNLTQSVAGERSFTLSNINTGSSAGVFLKLISDGGNGFITKYSLASSDAGRLKIQDATGIILSTAATNRAILSNTGSWNFLTNTLSNIGQLNVDNINIDGNTISSTDTNGNLIIDPNGTGDVIFNGSTTGATNASYIGTSNVLINPSTQVTISTGGTIRLFTNSTATQVNNQFRLSQETDQLRFGSTNPRTISVAAPSASRIYTIPDFGTNDTFVGLAATQTLSNKTLTSPIIGGTPSASGATWSNLGIVTTVDINGGTIDGTTIGGTTAAAGSFTTVNASSDVAFDTDGFFWDQSVRRLGLGYSSPNYILHLVENVNASSAIRLDQLSAGASASAFLSIHTKEDGGDPQIGFGIDPAGSGAGVSSINAWHFGLDNDDDDTFKFSHGNLGASGKTKLSIIGNADNNGFIGINIPAPAFALDITGTRSWIVGKHVTTDASAKAFQVGTGHYTNAEEPFLNLYGISNATENILNIGGGHSTGNAATTINFYTAANNTTTIGTLRGSISFAGAWSTNGGSLTAGDITGDSYTGTDLTGTGTEDVQANASGTLVRIVSDKHYKKTIKEFTQEEARRFVLSAKPYTYKYKDKDWGINDNWGFIANYVDEAYGKSPAFRKNKEGYFGWDTKQMIAPLYGTVQLHNSEILELKEKIAELEAQIEKLK